MHCLVWIRTKIGSFAGKLFTFTLGDIGQLQIWSEHSPSLQPLCKSLYLHRLHVNFKDLVCSWQSTFNLHPQSQKLRTIIHFHPLQNGERVKRPCFCGLAAVQKITLYGLLKKCISDIFGKEGTCHSTQSIYNCHYFNSFFWDLPGFVCQQLLK